VATEPDEKIKHLIKRCIENDRRSQKELYKCFYALAMGICLRYANNKEDAVSIMNEGFFKVFNKIGIYDFDRPFEGWLRRIMTNTAIDFYRSTLRFVENTTDLDGHENTAYIADTGLEKLYYKDLLDMVQALTPGYRTVFNLYALEGYSHEEIAEMLGISTGTSKSNLFKARVKLMDMIRLSDNRAFSGIINNGG
jgi:RNA polymerase sigma factor (sigma-70 family)